MVTAWATSASRGSGRTRPTLTVTPTASATAQRTVTATVAPMAARNPWLAKITMRYDAPLQGIETLDRDKEWESGYTVSSDGEELFEGRFTLSYKRSANVVIGECRYNVWVVEARMYRPELYSNFEQLYAPKLGIVLGSVAKDAEDTPVSGVFFDHIERAP